MVGGMKMSAGRLSLLAAAGFLLVGGTSAQAADFGGDCCADLEERIAELEATTARKGNRKVSLEVYGQINEAMAWWDDGLEDNVYLYTNDTSRTRIGFKGKAKISDDLYAGYRLELGIRTVDQGEVNANTSRGWSSSNPGGFDLRHSYWFLGSKTYGEVLMGETSMSHDGITQMQTANIGHFANPDIIDNNDSFGIVSGLTRSSNWDSISQVFEPGEGSRGAIVRYNTPEIAGFMASAHWGEDDIWGMALTYAGELGAFEVEAGIGYGEMTLRDEECTEVTVVGGIKSDCQEYGMSLNVMHNPSGIFVTGAYGKRIDHGRADRLAVAGYAADEDLQFWHIQAGIEQKWTPLGKTTVFGGYQDRDSGMPVNDDGGALITYNGNNVISSNIEMWEVGVNQQLEAAAMDLYLHYKHYDAELVTDVGGAATAVSTEPFQTLIGGARIKF